MHFLNHCPFMSLSLVVILLCRDNFGSFFPLPLLRKVPRGSSINTQICGREVIIYLTMNWEESRRC